MITSELCSLGPHLIFFSYMLICQCVVKPSINELLAALFILIPSLQPCWVLPLLGKVLLRLAHHNTHLLQGGRCSARMKTK